MSPHIIAFGAFGNVMIDTIAATFPAKHLTLANLATNSSQNTVQLLIWLQTFN